MGPPGKAIGANSGFGNLVGAAQAARPLIASRAKAQRRVIVVELVMRAPVISPQQSPNTLSGKRLLSLTF